MRPSPWGNDAFLPVSNFPLLFPKNFSDSVEKFPKLTFSKEISRFSIAKNLEFPPYFRYFNTFPPVFRKISHFSLYIYKFPPDFVKFTRFFYILCVFDSPYFHHDAFMQHTMHVLDAPEGGKGNAKDNGRYEEDLQVGERCIRTMGVFGRIF